jgi:benzoylformate decarboxylase
MTATVAAVDAFVRQLEAEGVRHVFGNPGTTEQAFVRAVSAAPSIDYIGALHEAVAVGMADGYARSRRAPAFVQLHASPGLGNAMGLVYDAAAGGTPLVIYVGEPDSRLTAQEPLLAGDLLAMARPFAKWTHRIDRAADLQRVVRRAFKIAAAAPAGVVVLSVPADVLDEPVELQDAVSQRVRMAGAGDPVMLARVARGLAGARAPLILFGDGVAAADAGTELLAVAAAVPAPLREVWTTEFVVPTDSDLFAGGLNLLAPASIRRVLAEHDVIVAFGASLFPLLTHIGQPLIAADQELIEFHADPWELGKNYAASTLLHGDLKPALAALAGLLGSGHGPGRDGDAGALRKAIADGRSTALARLHARHREQPDGGAIAPLELALEVAAALGDEDVLFDEAITLSGVLRTVVPRLRPGTYYLARGGGLGQGMPGPLGVKLAQPERRVLAIVGDGSAMYTIQSLWTAARHGIAVGWVIADNGRYHILDRNLAHHLGAPAEEPAFDLRPPALDFVKLAQGLGIAATVATSRAELRDALAAWRTLDEPFLIDARMPDPLAGDGVPSRGGRVAVSEVGG